MSALHTALLAKLAKRISKLETAETEKVRHGVDGKDGAKGEKGIQGERGLPGKDGKKGLDGKDGKDGKDGVGVSDVYSELGADLTFVMTDGSEHTVELESFKEEITKNIYVTHGSSSTAASGALNWIDYATGFSSTPTLTQTIATGDVYTYTYTNGTLYRLVPSGAEQDAFYNQFSGGVLSGLVAIKSLSI